MTTHMIIPDSHANPDIPNDRFLWAGRLALERKPDVIINIGDWLDMESLCSYDRGKKQFEGRRYHRDIACGNAALDLFEQPIREYNFQQALHKKKQYKPRKVWLDGNHEHRVTRAEEDNPAMESMLPIHKELGLKRRGWDVSAFLVPVHIDGVVYQHFFTSGPMGNSISGHFSGRRIIQEIHRSGTCGHSHYFNYFHDTDGFGNQLHGLVVGCFFEHPVTYTSIKDQQKWWRGIVFKNNVSNGDYDLETIRLSTIKEMYSD